MATTHTWLPKFLAISSISSGLRRAAELMETLSAPALNRRSTSFSSLMPPPTVKGMLILAATFLTSSVNVLRPSCEAVISKYTNSSAPSRLYCAPSSTGSPASRKFTKLIPLTVFPSFMSKQGTILLASIYNHSFLSGEADQVFQLYLPFVNRFTEDDSRNTRFSQFFNILYGTDASAGYQVKQRYLFPYLLI